MSVHHDCSPCFGYFQTSLLLKQLWKWIGKDTELVSTPKICNSLEFGTVLMYLLVIVFTKTLRRFVRYGKKIIFF